MWYDYNYVVGPMLKYDNCVAGRAGPGHRGLLLRAGPGPDLIIQFAGPGRVCTTAAGPARPGPQFIVAGLGLNVRPLQGPSGCLSPDMMRVSAMQLPGKTREVWSALAINNTFNRPHVIIIIIIMYLPIKIGIYSNCSTHVIFLIILCDSLFVKKLSYLRG